MAVEGKRLCGWRKVNGLYLCDGYINVPCDRLPLPLTTCPVCSQGIKLSRAFTEVNPLRLWGLHRDCGDPYRPCFLCDPEDRPAYIMTVGEKHYKTPGDFLDEARRMGVSKRIPFIPKGLALGQTIIYLAHPKAVQVAEEAAVREAERIIHEHRTKQPKLVDIEVPKWSPGIFSAFIPKRVEQLVWKSELSEEKVEQLTRRNITPVLIPDGDKDHE